MKYFISYIELKTTDVKNLTTTQHPILWQEENTDKTMIFWKEFKTIDLIGR